MARLLLLLLVCSAVFVGCAAPSPIAVSVTSNYSDEFERTGTVAVVPSDKSLIESLEFEHHRAEIEERFRSIGYGTTRDVDLSDYVVLVAYGVGASTTKLESSRVLGKTGAVSSSTGAGAIGEGTGSAAGASGATPSHGMVGAHTSRVREYERAIVFRIYDTGSLATEVPRIVYESKITSHGKCSSIDGIFDELLDTLFANWPGENGATREAVLPATAGC